MFVGSGLGRSGPHAPPIGQSGSAEAAMVSVAIDITNMAKSESLSFSIFPCPQRAYGLFLQLNCI
jgi:hypothetical protein